MHTGEEDHALRLSPKRHVDRFGRFGRVDASVPNTQTDQETRVACSGDRRSRVCGEWRSADRVQSSVTQGHRMPCAMSSVCSAGSVDAQPGVAACARHCGGRGRAVDRRSHRARAPRSAFIHHSSSWWSLSVAGVKRRTPLLNELTRCSAARRHDNDTGE